MMKITAHTEVPGIYCHIHDDRVAVRYSTKTKLRYCAECWDARMWSQEPVEERAFWPSF